MYEPLPWREVTWWGTLPVQERKGVVPGGDGRLLKAMISVPVSRQPPLCVGLAWILTKKSFINISSDTGRKKKSLRRMRLRFFRMR
jgi:hypothetical protein